MLTDPCSWTGTGFDESFVTRTFRVAAAASATGSGARSHQARSRPPAATPRKTTSSWTLLGRLEASPPTLLPGWAPGHRGYLYRGTRANPRLVTPMVHSDDCQPMPTAALSRRVEGRRLPAALRDGGPPAARVSGCTARGRRVGGPARGVAGGHPGSENRIGRSCTSSRANRSSRSRQTVSTPALDARS